MSPRRSILSALPEGMTPDGSLVRARLRVTVDMLVTLVVSLIAIALVVTYQVLRHLPESWRERLLADGDTQE